MNFFTDWRLMKNMLFSAGLYGVTLYIYTGVIFSAENLHGNIYFNNGLLCLADLVSALIASLCLN